MARKKSEEQADKGPVDVGYESVTKHKVNGNEYTVKDKGKGQETELYDGDKLIGTFPTVKKALESVDPKHSEKKVSFPGVK